MTVSTNISPLTGPRPKLRTSQQEFCSSTTTTIQTLGPLDVLCGRCRTAFHNVGNRRFRVIIQMNLQAYLQCQNKSEKSKLIASIANTCRECGARFLRPQKGGRFYYTELNNREMLQKVGHALRDMAVAQQRSKMAEHNRRQKKQQQEQTKQ